MSVKFSVGVSETDEDRALLETLRRSPSRIEPSADDTTESGPAGWPLGADTEEDTEPRASTWAW